MTNSKKPNFLYLSAICLSYVIYVIVRLYAKLFKRIINLIKISFLLLIAIEKRNIHVEYITNILFHSNPDEELLNFIIIVILIIPFFENLDICD